MRANAERSQSGTQQHVTAMLLTLSAEMSGTIDGLRQQAEASGEATRFHQQQISEEARRAVEGLAGEVRSQTQALEQATSVPTLTLGSRFLHGDGHGLWRSFRV